MSGSGPRVAHFSAKSTGGAAIAARRLHDGLVAAGVDSRFLYGQGAAPRDDGSYRRIDYRLANRTGARGLAQRLRERRHRRRYREATRGGMAGVDRFAHTELPWATPVPAEGASADVIQLHWVSGFLDYPTFFGSMERGRPIVWTLHDMDAFTAGCHYAWDCERFTTRCVECPQLSSEGPDHAAATFATRDAALHGHVVHAVADSRWLEGEASRSRLLGGAASLRTIHYGLDTDVYAPRDKRACKAALGIDPERFVIAFGATSLHNRRKGLTVLLEALAALEDKETVLGLVFGPGVRDYEIGDLPRIMTLGPVQSRELIVAVYSAADVFVIPSLQEAFGQTAMEAMACGTPVVGSRTGGIPELVRPGETGLLASPGDASDLARSLERLRSDEALRARLSAGGRQLIEREFTRERQARAYVELYEEITSNAARPTRP